MAVYTKVTLEDANEFLDKYYDLGNLVSITEITQGVENTNYIIETNNCKYILTLFEQRVSAQGIVAKNKIGKIDSYFNISFKGFE